MGAGWAGWAGLGWAGLVDTDKLFNFGSFLSSCGVIRRRYGLIRTLESNLDPNPNLICNYFTWNVKTFVCGKKNIWSLNCQKLFITPLLEIFRPKISLIAENTEWFQHCSWQGPGDSSQSRLHILRHSLYLGNMMESCSHQLFTHNWFHDDDYFFVLRLSQLRNCVSTERSTSDPFHFTTSVKLAALLEPTVFIFPEQSWQRWPWAAPAPPWPGWLVGGARPDWTAAYSQPIARQW